MSWLACDRAPPQCHEGRCTNTSITSNNIAINTIASIQDATKTVAPRRLHSQGCWWRTLCGNTLARRGSLESSEVAHISSPWLDGTRPEEVATGLEGVVAVAVAVAVAVGLGEERRHKSSCS